MAGVAPKGVLKRALRNAGMLLGGKASAGLMQLATFAIAARSLGIHDFGILAVMLSGMQGLIALATFQSNQAIVRYGVHHLNSDDRSGFQKLMKFGLLLDLTAAGLASGAALLLASVIGELAGWDEAQVDAWRLLALLPPMVALATPKGLLRLFGRFDLLARHVTITPLVRLIGAVLLHVTGAQLIGWIVMWLVAGAAGLAVGFWFAFGEVHRRHLLSGMDASMRGLRSANPGILGFSLIANLHSSLSLLPGHVATFAVGIVLGPQSAGLMKVAQEIGTALAKPIDLINQSVYPDIARLSAEGAWKRVRRLIVRAGAMASGASAITTLLLLAAGGPIITLVFGDEYAGAMPLLILISFATTFTVAVFAIDPTLYALGKPSRPLISAAVANAFFVAVMFASFPVLGLLAPGAAYLAAGLATVGMAAWWMSRVVPR